MSKGERCSEFFAVVIRLDAVQDSSFQDFWPYLSGSVILHIVLPWYKIKFATPQNCLSVDWSWKVEHAPCWLTIYASLFTKGCSGGDHNNFFGEIFWVWIIHIWNHGFIFNISVLNCSTHRKFGPVYYKIMRGLCSYKITYIEINLLGVPWSDGL